MAAAAKISLIIAESHFWFVNSRRQYVNWQAVSADVSSRSSYADREGHGVEFNNRSPRADVFREQCQA
jgi:hypothetical protein